MIPTRVSPCFHSFYYVSHAPVRLRRFIPTENQGYLGHVERNVAHNADTISKTNLLYDLVHKGPTKDIDAPYDRSLQNRIIVRIADHDWRRGRHRLDYLTGGSQKGDLLFGGFLGQRPATDLGQDRGRQDEHMWSGNTGSRASPLGGTLRLARTRMFLSRTILTGANCAADARSQERRRWLPPSRRAWFRL